MHGLHLTADLRACRANRAELTDAGALRTCCLQAVAAAGLQTVGGSSQQFAPAGIVSGGVTGVGLLGESHRVAKSRKESHLAAHIRPAPQPCCRRRKLSSCRRAPSVTACSVVSPRRLDLSQARGGAGLPRSRLHSQSRFNERCPCATSRST